MEEGSHVLNKRKEQLELVENTSSNCSFVPLFKKEDHTDTITLTKRFFILLVSNYITNSITKSKGILTKSDAIVTGSMFQAFLYNRWFKAQPSA